MRVFDFEVALAAWRVACKGAEIAGKGGGSESGSERESEQPGLSFEGRNTGDTARATLNPKP